MTKNTQQQVIEHFDQYDWQYWGTLTTTNDSDPFWLESLFHR